MLYFLIPPVYPTPTGHKNMLFHNKNSKDILYLPPLELLNSPFNPVLSRKHITAPLSSTSTFFKKGWKARRK